MMTQNQKEEGGEQRPQSLQSLPRRSPGISERPSYHRAGCPQLGSLRSDSGNRQTQTTMKYDEFTPEEIEDLVRECDRMAEEIPDLQDRNAEARRTVLRALRSHAIWACKTIDKALA